MLRTAGGATKLVNSVLWLLDVSDIFGVKCLEVDVDWIKARLECSTDHVWASLKDRLKQDASEWDKKVRPPASVERLLEITEEKQSLRITAFHKALNTNSSLFVSRSRLKISAYQELDMAEDTKTPIVEFFPALNSEGQCRLLSNDRELEIWQVSRALLEPILFR